MKPFEMRLFWRSPKPSAPRSTAGRIIYAVGDIHGKIDLLNLLLREIAADALTQPIEGRPVLVFLGDYIDRGPASAAVIERLLQLRSQAAFEVRFLKGNHEEALLRFLQEPDIGPEWIHFGAAATLSSYGVVRPSRVLDGADWPRLRDAFAAALPASHLQFFRALELMVIIGDYAFVHAGVRPGKPLGQQVEADLLWIRNDFLRVAKPSDKVIVHGHSAEAEPQVTRHRIGLDTGAYVTGVLTAVRLGEEHEPRILQARAARISVN